MVRVTRFSFDDGMNVEVPRPRDSFDDDLDEIDDPVADDQRQRAPHTGRSRRRRATPDDRRPDRRQVVGEDWERPQPPDESKKGPEE